MGVRELETVERKGLAGEGRQKCPQGGDPGHIQATACNYLTTVSGEECVQRIREGRARLECWLQQDKTSCDPQVLSSARLAKFAMYACGTGEGGLVGSIHQQ